MGVNVPGQTCDVVLRHARHEDLPLICYRRVGDMLGPRVRVHYEVYWPADAANEPVKVRHLFFSVVVAEGLLCPDGGWYELAPGEVRQRLNAILLEDSEIMLETQMGSIAGLCTTEHAVIDTIYQGSDVLEIHMSTRVLVDYPAKPEAVANIWLRDDVGSDAVSQWGSARWV